MWTNIFKDNTDNILTLKILSFLSLLCTTMCYEIIQSPLSSKKKSVVFFPVQLSYNDQLPVDIYGEFKKSLQSNGFHVFQSSGNTNEDCNLINDMKLADELDKVTLVSHSTGINNLLKVCDKVQSVDNVVLIDPILLKKSRERFVFNENLEDYINDFIESDKFTLLKDAIFKKNDKKYLTFDNIDNLLYISSKKSSRWKILPPIPPIKRLFLDYNEIKSINKTLITIPEYGHFDILDTQWSDMIHSSISKGSNFRDTLTNYHDDISNYIKEL